MHQKTLFKILAREGECWHEPKLPSYHGQQICKHCGFRWVELKTFPNPDFSTPDGFFWLWDRAKEKEWWPRFLNERYYAKECWDRMEDIDCDHVISTKFINPQRFHAALVEFLEAQG